MDRRQQKTRDAIFAAFGELLASKTYSKITIQHIIDCANVGRTTFYAHFETKDDLLRQLCDDLFVHVFSDSLDMERTHDFSMQAGDPHAMVTHMLYHLLDNSKNISGILTGESGELFLGYFRQYLKKRMAVFLLEYADTSSRPVPYDFLINHFVSSFIGMVQWWIENKLAQTPEELADYFMTVIMPVL